MTSTDFVPADVNGPADDAIGQRSKHMSSNVKQILLEFFAKCNAFELWNDTIRNSKIRAIIKLSKFMDYNRNQIKRVYDLYASTVSLKKIIATSVVAKTNEMINDNVKSILVESMISLLGNVYFQS